MASNPARTFALVNIAIFALAIAAILWLRHSGLLDMDSENALMPADSAPSSADTLSVADVRGTVQPASAAQISFINEVLTDSADVVQQGYAVRSRRHTEAYYVGAPVVRADTSMAKTARIAVWLIAGSFEQPSAIASVNEVAAQYSLASPGSSAEVPVSMDNAEAQAVLERARAQRP